MKEIILSTEDIQTICKEIAGKLEEKLGGQYDESSISEIMEYFETKDSSLVKKKCRKK